MPNEFVGPLITGGITLAIALVAWVWNLSSRTAQVTYLAQRITLLEQAEVARSARLDSIAVRLSRIEPMISYLVDQYKASQRV